MGGISSAGSSESPTHNQTDWRDDRRYCVHHQHCCGNKWCLLVELCIRWFMRIDGGVVLTTSDQDTICIRLPPHHTYSDIHEVQGVLADALMGYIDWEKLYNHEADAVSPAGTILASIVKALKDHVDGDG